MSNHSRDRAEAAGVTASLEQALQVEGDGNHWSGAIHPGWDVFGAPLGGYLMAQAARVGLAATGARDVFTVTTHFLAKASVGPLVYRVEALGGGRRLRSHLVVATQGDRAVTASVMSLGDRDTISGPTWEQRVAPELDGPLTGPAGTGDDRFPTPASSHRLGLRLERETLGFTAGQRGEAVMRGLVDPEVATPTDQLLALVACDATPPAAWNALGAEGWVPTVELTAHVRARPRPGPLRVVTTTRSVSGGLLEEDGEVYDGAGHLVVLSRQLARWTESR